MTQIIASIFLLVLEPLAMRPAFVMVLKVTPPLALQETFTAVANRAAYTHDLSLYQEFELNEVRRRELYAVLSELPGGIRYLNVTGPDVSPSTLKSGRLPGPPTIRGEATPLSRLSPDVDDEGEAPQRPGIRHQWPAQRVLLVGDLQPAAAARARYDRRRAGHSAAGAAGACRRPRQHRERRARGHRAGAAADRASAPALNRTEQR